MTPAGYSTIEIMTIAAARLLKNGAVCFVGIGLPSTAANLARLKAGQTILVATTGEALSHTHDVSGGSCA